MKKYSVIIVDDSSFSGEIAKDILEEKGFEVLAKAESLAELKVQLEKYNPDLITMDITLPDGNGLDYSKVILKANPEAKIIVISAMMDLELINKAKSIGVCGFIQKPLDKGQFDAVIDKIFQGEELFEKLQKIYENIFKESFDINIKRMIDNDAVLTKENVIEEKVRSVSGYSANIGIIGRHLGRVILDMSLDTAVAAAKKATGKQEVTKREISIFLAEIANIITGNAVSSINGFDQAFGMRVSPPTVFFGQEFFIGIGDMDNKSFIISTTYGEIFLNVGFQRGTDSWM